MSATSCACRRSSACAATTTFSRTPSRRTSRSAFSRAKTSTTSIELINDPRGFTSITDTSVDTTNPNQPAHYRVITTTTTEAFRFSLQFAKRFGPFTGRFGIKESTGGIGLDIHLLQDRFEIVNDLFGFSEEVQPRYRVYVSYEFIKQLWLLGGVDHLSSSRSATTSSACSSASTTRI